MSVSGDDVAATSERRCYDVVCLLGSQLHYLVGL